MKVNQAAVKDAILYKILDVSKVSLLRIGQIEVINLRKLFDKNFLQY
jgi:hypothetical protein